MELHHELRDMVGGHGSGLLEEATTSRGAIDDAATFRGALDDYFPEGRIPAGDANLLVDAVRLGALSSLVRMIDWGGDPVASVESAANAFARDRGGLPYAAAAWACAVLGYAVGRVPEQVVHRFPPMSAAQLWSNPAQPPDTIAPPPPPIDQTVAPVDRTMWSPYSDSYGAVADATIAGRPRASSWQPPAETGPQAPPSAPAVPARRGPFVLLAVVAAVLAAAIGGGIVVVLGHDNGSPSASGAATSHSRHAKSAHPSRSASEAPTPTTSKPADHEVTPSADPAHPAPDVPALQMRREEQPECQDSYIVVLAKGYARPGSKKSVVEKYDGRAGVWKVDRSDLRYLSNRGSCLGGNPNVLEVGHPATYQVYRGPFTSLAQACSTRASLHDPRVWIRHLDPEGPYGVFCFCEHAPAVLANTTYAPSTPYFEVAEVQQMFLTIDNSRKEPRYNPSKLIGGRMQEFASGLKAFQIDNNLSDTGTFTIETWTAIQRTAGCG